MVQSVSCFILFSFITFYIIFLAIPKSLSISQQYVPLATCFCNPALRQRHWDEMSEIAGFDLTPNAGTTLRKIINMNLMDDLLKYQKIYFSIYIFT